MSSNEFLEDLEADVYEAIKTLEKERYYEFSWALAEMVRQCKHYQRISESVLGGHAGLPLGLNQEEFHRAHRDRDWFRYPERPQAVQERGEIEQ